MPDAHANTAIDPVELTQALIRCQSVTPHEGGALALLAERLKPLGFACARHDFSEAGTADVANLFAKIGNGSPHLCFAGHSDTVPVGDAQSWTVDPFAGAIVNNHVTGRGATDMKGAIAAFAAAASRFLAGRPKFAGAISLLITGDEEGPAINGTQKVLRAIAQQGEAIDACIVGEPTSKTKLGDMMKIGRRGSMTGFLTVHGIQGHIAYPHLADNPVHRLARMMAALIEKPLDAGTDFFEASSLQFYTADVGNQTNNLIPAKAAAAFNIRFNDLHTSKSLEREIRAKLDGIGGRYDLEISVSGEAFFTPPGPLSALVSGAVETVTGLLPELSTTGGTSDARFIRQYCPVVEFGLPNATMHKIDERAAVGDIAELSRIYELIIERFFAGGGAR